MLPAPQVIEHAGYLVVRDDLLPGGTKRRALLPLLSGRAETEFVYASPAYGYAQLALAYTAASLGKRATVFTAKRKTPHPLTLRAKEAGAKIVMVPHGYLSNVQAKAQAYCAKVGAAYLPFGLDTDVAIDAVADAARSVRVTPAEVWTVSGSGMLTRALQRAWPQADFKTVIIGKENPAVGQAQAFKAPEKFEQDAKLPPPWPSCANYDAKAWRFMQEHASAGALFWNVGS